jgi:hypothetical protein
MFLDHQQTINQSIHSSSGIGSKKWPSLLIAHDAGPAGKI